MRKILVVGGAGYVGAVLTDHLLNENYQVRSFDQFLYQNNHCVLPYLGRTGYESHYGDLCDTHSVLNSLENVSDVVLLAGLVGDPITKKFPKISKRINEENSKTNRNPQWPRNKSFDICLYLFKLWID